MNVTLQQLILWCSSEIDSVSLALCFTAGVSVNHSASCLSLSLSLCVCVHVCLCLRVSVYVCLCVFTCRPLRYIVNDGFLWLFYLLTCYVLLQRNSVFLIWKRLSSSSCFVILLQVHCVSSCTRLSVDPLMSTLKPDSNGPLYSNTVIGTLAVDGWAVTFGAARSGLGGLGPRPVHSSLYQM